jgi:DNA-binding Lrp family transcriptional regulator
MNAPLAPTIRMDDIDRGLVDSFQRGVAIVARPYAAIGEALGVREEEVMTRLGRLIAAGAVSRFGAVVRPHAAGASTLAALAAPPERLDAAAEIVSGFAGVTHNYAREHDWSLWFVVTGRDAADVAATLAGIGRRTGLAVLDLPLERAYHIDLGFPMFGAPAEDQRLRLRGPRRRDRPRHSGADRRRAGSDPPTFRRRSRKPSALTRRQSSRASAPCSTPESSPASASW